MGRTLPPDPGHGTADAGHGTADAGEGAAPEPVPELSPRPAPADPGPAPADPGPAPAAGPPAARSVEYKGAPLDAERGPGLGCFWLQVVILVVFIVLTPLSVLWNWPPLVSGILLFVVIGLLLLTGQTVIFLLRLVAAERRGRRRPLASGTRTVGELEDEARTGEPPAAGSGDLSAAGSEEPESDARSMRE